MIKIISKNKSIKGINCLFKNNSNLTIKKKIKDTDLNSTKIENILYTDGIYQGEVIEENVFGEKDLLKIKFFLSDDGNKFEKEYYVAYCYKNKLSDKLDKKNLNFRLAILNYKNSDVTIDNYPVISLDFNIDDSEKKDSNMLIELSSGNLKKINEFVVKNKVYFLDLMKEYNMYCPYVDVDNKILLLLDKIIYGSKNLISYEKESGDKLVFYYNKQDNKKTIKIKVLEIDKNNVYTLFKFKDEKVFNLESGDSFNILEKLKTLYKKFSIKSVNGFNLDDEFSKLFIDVDNSDFKDYIVDEFDIEEKGCVESNDSILLNKSVENEKEKEERILVVSGDRCALDKDNLRKILNKFNLNRASLDVCSDYERMTNVADRIFQKINNKYYSAVICGSAPHSVSGKGKNGSFIDGLKSCCLGNCFYFNAGDIVIDNNNNLGVKLSVSRFKLAIHFYQQYKLQRNN